MAHLETWHRCPVCNKCFGSFGEAVTCRNKHMPKSEMWAVGKTGKAVRIYGNHAPNSCNGINGALREADLSDNIETRKKQLAEMEVEQ